MKNRTFFLYVVMLFLLGSWLPLHQAQAAGNMLYWSDEDDGIYQPLHSHTLAWSDENLILNNGGFDLETMSITDDKNKSKADFVINQYGDIGSRKIAKLSQQSLSQPVDLREVKYPTDGMGYQIFGIKLEKGGIYLIQMDNGKYAKLRIDDVSATSVKFSFVMETAQPPGDPSNPGNPGDPSDPGNPGGNNPPSEKEPTVIKLSASNSNLTVYAGKYTTVSLTAEYSDKKKKTVTSTANWYSQHSSIATVSKGKITGTSPGKTTITAEYGGKKVVIPVTVILEKVKPIKGIPGTAIAAGANHTLVLKKDGTVWSFGKNESGQLGTGDNSLRIKPVKVKGINNVKAIAAGYSISFALKKDGTVWIWGDPFALVNGPRTYPQKIPYLNNVVAIAAGDEHLMALKKDGTVWVWGGNAFGQGGIGTTSPADLELPVKVKNLKNVVSVGAGRFHSSAVKSDGTVWAWGYNNWGQIGNGGNGFGNVLLPTKVLLPAKAKTVSGGTYHSLAVASDNSAYSWGYNDKGQLGIPKNNVLQNRPAQIRGINGDGFLWNVRQLDGGDGYSVAVTNDGSVYGWGENDYGKLGNNRSTDSLFPVKVPITNVVQVEAGEDHTVALKSDGTVWAWGSNIDGQLGVGGKELNKRAPVKVMNANTPPLPPKVKTVTSRDSYVKGTSEPGATIKVKAGSKTYKGTVKKNKTFAVKISKQKAGNVLIVTATDKSGKVSKAVKVVVKK